MTTIVFVMNFINLNIIIFAIKIVQIIYSKFKLIRLIDIYAPILHQKIIILTAKIIFIRNAIHYVKDVENRGMIRIIIVMNV